METTSEQQAALYAALAAAQGEFKPIIPDRTVEVRLKDGKGKYIFRYATLGAVIEATRGALSTQGLALTTLVDPKLVRVMLLHSGGGVLENSAPAPSCSDWQDYGSDLTYIRRYLVSALLGVASEYDDDGNRSKGNEIRPEPEPADTLWNRLDAAGVPTEPRDRRSWCERVLGRSLPDSDAISDVDAARLLDVAEKRSPMPPEPQPRANEAKLKLLNDALDRLAPWGEHGLDGLDPKQSAAKRKNAKLAWISSMVIPPRRVSTSAHLTAAEVEALTVRANAGEIPQSDPLPAWMETTS